MLAQIQIEESIAVQRLNVAHQWLKDNPALADMPGAPFPPLDPVNIALEVLTRRFGELHGLTLVPLSKEPPTTQPN